jgi:hypothetical protein
MPGDNKTLPFWRRRRPNRLALERALSSERRAEERLTDAERAVIERELARQVFELSKGRIHPPA